MKLFSWGYVVTEYDDSVSMNLYWSKVVLVRVCIYVEKDFDKKKLVKKGFISSLSL